MSQRRGDPAIRAYFWSGAVAAVGLAAALGLAAPAGAEVVPDWVRHMPVGTSLAAGMAGFVVDAAGNSYVTGIGGSSSNTDVVTASFAPDGTLRWTRTWDGPAGWHDQARAIALGEDGHLYVTGNTPGPGSYANVLVLEYDAATGDLLDSVQLAAAEWASEHGGSITADDAGNVYICGGTTGDGGDAMVLSLDSAGELRWRQTWDGAAWAPYSQDNAEKVVLDPSGDPVVMVHGVMASNHPDYVVLKYDSLDGQLLWEANWGVSGGDFPRDLEIDADGDVYVTGTGIDWIDKYSTIKLRGSDGALLWQRYDAIAPHQAASGLALDGHGGVYITGAADPDGDHSNFNDNFFTVKRSAATGDLLWSHSYGANCLWCYDVPSDLIVDPAGNLFLAGSTSSPPYSSDALLLVLDNATGLETDRGVVSAGVSEGAGTGILKLDGAANLYDGGGFSNFDTGAVEMTVTRWPSLLEPIFFQDFEDGARPWSLVAR
jgi:hypothetical protein